MAPKGLFLLLAVVGLAGGGVCAALLGALRSVSRARLREVVVEEAARQRLLDLLDDERRWLVANVVLRTACIALAATGLAAPLLVASQASVDGLVEVILVLLIGLGLADTVPRAIGDAWPERTLAAALPAFSLVARAATPVVSAFGVASSVVVRILGGEVRSQAEEAADSLLSAALEGVSEGILDPSATHLIENALRFQDKEVRDVMTPRTEVTAVPVDAPVDHVVKVLAETKYSRVPVYEGTPDRVVGIFYAKDVLAQELVESGVRALMRKPLFVPETKKVSDLLREFRRGRSHLAVVVDEHGGTAGIVTASDLVEEILGDIRDEYDEPEPPRVKKIGDGAFELVQATGVEVPEDPDYETIAGFVTTALGKIPAKGELVPLNGTTFLVTDADERRVKRLRLTTHRTAPRG